MSTATFLRSGAIYGIANVLSAGVPFLLLPILTRALEPDQFGDVVLFYILISLCTGFAGLSLQAAVGVRWLDPSKGDPRGYTAAAIKLVLISTAITAVATAALAPAFGLHLSPEVCALAAVVAGTNTLQAIRFSIWQAQSEPWRAATLQVGAAVANIGLSLLGVLVLSLGGAGRIYGAVAAGVLVATLSCYSMFASGVAAGGSRKDTARLLRFGVPLVPHVLAGAVLVSVDRFSVGHQLSAAALGVYGAAAQLGQVLNVVADASIKAYTPYMYSMLRDGTDQSKLNIVAITYLSAPFWLLGALAIWVCYMLLGGVLLGEQYREAIDLTIWFLLGGAASGVYMNVAGLFFFTGRTEWLSAATLSAALFALVVAPLAVDRFGVVGAGATYAAAQCLLCVMAWGLSRWTTPMPWGSPLLAGRTLARAALRSK